MVMKMNNNCSVATAHRPIEKIHPTISESQHKYFRYEHMNSSSMGPILLYDATVTSAKPSLIANHRIESVANWFLSKAPLSNKKLQKLCYYAYAWFIVFFNDLEYIGASAHDIQVLCPEKFQAWIHGPVCPYLYQKYRIFGWTDIQEESFPISFPQELEDLLNQVWDIYGKFTADELEAISHNELPWQNARRGFAPAEPCTNEIDDYDILRYYSSLR